MELPPTSSTSLPLARWLGVLLAALALGYYAFVLVRHVNACAGDSDSSGYWNHARLIATGRVHVAPRVIDGLPSIPTSPYLYVPLGFKPAPHRADLVPTYPIGLSLMILSAAPFTGWSHAGDCVLCLHAILGVILTYALGRAFGLTPAWSTIGAAVLAASPLYLFLSLQAMSDVPALVWTTAAVLAAWRGSLEAGHRRMVWIAAAGAAFAMAVLIRPSNLIALIPCATALLWARRQGNKIMQNGLWFLVGGLPGTIVFCVHNMRAYGQAITTGYGDIRSDFEWRLIGPTLLHYAHWFSVLFTPVVALFLALPVLGRAQSKVIAVLGGWAFVYLAFYVSYRYTHETWWYMRFLLPAVPALIVGGLLVARRAVNRFLSGRCEGSHRTGCRRMAFTVYMAALALVITNGVWWTQRFHALAIGKGIEVYPQTAAWLREHVPSDAVLAVMQVSGALFYYTDFTVVRWDQLDAANFGRIAAAAKEVGRPIYAALFPFETEEALHKRMPGVWSRVGSVREVTFWRYNEH